MKKSTIKIKTNTVKTYYYTVEDNYGCTVKCNSLEEAQRLLEWYKGEKDLLKFLKKKGATLVVSKTKGVWHRGIAAFIGYNGAPFCEMTKYEYEDRDHFMGLSNTLQMYSGIHGNLVEVLTQAYNLLEGLGHIDIWRGAHHYRWDPIYGIPYAVDRNDSHWVNGVYWYNFNGKRFTTNDPKYKGKIHLRDFKDKICPKGNVY